MRLVEVPVMVMRPPMVAAYVMLRDRHLQIMWSLLVGYMESLRILGFLGTGTSIETCRVQMVSADLTRRNISLCSDVQQFVLNLTHNLLEILVFLRCI